MEAARERSERKMGEREKERKKERERETVIETFTLYELHIIIVHTQHCMAVATSIITTCGE